jgi:prolyl 4-hydroxylase
MKGVNSSTTVPLAAFRDIGEMNITLTVVSVSPRILQIDNFLSDVEVDHILDLAIKKNLQRSTTGMGGSDSHESDTRTSRTTWLKRNSSPIMNAIIRRGADVLKIDEALLRTRSTGEMPEVPFLGAINEELQIVHYAQGQQYTAHHDFGYPGTRPNSPSRSINLCMYLNEGMVGGETAFPRWRNADTDDAVKAVPKRGKVCAAIHKIPLL